MNESASLTNLLQKAFQMAGESVPLGFDVSKIQPTLTCGAKPAMLSNSPCYTDRRWSG
jgi:hypothetical protein